MKFSFKTYPHPAHMTSPPSSHCAFRSTLIISRCDIFSHGSGGFTSVRTGGMVEYVTFPKVSTRGGSDGELDFNI